MRDWLPAWDPVWLMISVIAGLDTSALHAGRRTGGPGRAGYDPDMLLTLLIWAWAHGVRSSRVIERLCQRDVAFRIICAVDAPDHVTISRFRAESAAAMESLFVQVLMLCARVGMGQLGVVALDSVEIAWDASLSANRSAEGLRRAAAEQSWPPRPPRSMRAPTPRRMLSTVLIAAVMSCPLSWSIRARAPRALPRRSLGSAMAVAPPNARPLRRVNAAGNRTSSSSSSSSVPPSSTRFADGVSNARSHRWACRRSRFASRF